MGMNASSTSENNEHVGVLSRCHGKQRICYGKSVVWCELLNGYCCVAACGKRHTGERRVCRSADFLALDFTY